MARINNRSLARIGLSFGAAALVALGTALPSFADTSVNVGTGSLSTGGSAINFANFAAVTLNGSAQKPTVSFSFADIVDSTGTGAGWHLTLNLSQFNDGIGVGLGHTLATSSLRTRNSPILSLIDPTSSALGTVHRGVALTTPGTPLDTAGDLVLLSADLLGGMGSYNLSPLDMALSLPADTAAAIYVSTAVVTLASAP